MRARHLVLLIAGVACGRAPGNGTPAPAAAVAVKAVPVSLAPVPRTLALTGSLRAPQDSDVAANASGRVTRTLVERGTRVSNGRGLVELDLRASAAAADEARANLESARAEKVLADRDCERNQRLLEKGAITQQEMEKASASCRMKSEAVTAAESRARKASDVLADGVVRTPFAGIVSERYVDVGEYVQAGAKVAHVVQTDPLRLELTVPEAEVGAVKEGLDVEFEVAALPGRTFHGTVTYVAPALRTSTRDLVFEAVVRNPDGALKPGMFASARLAVGSVSLPTVPREAIRQDGESARAFVVKDGKLEERVLQLGSALGERVTVKSGLAVGERVAARAGADLADGLAVH